MKLPVLAIVVVGTWPTDAARYLIFKSLLIDATIHSLAAFITHPASAGESFRCYDCYTPDTPTGPCGDSPFNATGKGVYTLYTTDPPQYCYVREAIRIQ